MALTAVLPVKPFARAKQRLSDRLSPGDRQALVVAMFSDVLVALSRSRAVDRVLVVTDDRGAEQLAAGYGAEVLADGQSSHSDAAVVGLEYARAAGAAEAMIVPGDCPLLDPGELDGLAERLHAMRERTAASAVIVPDRHGTGTNALALTLGT